MVARAEFALNDAALDTGEDRFAGQDVVQPPADVARLHVAPRGPPREHLIVPRFQGAARVHESVRDDPLEQGALFRELSDRARLSFLRVHVDLGARDVQVPAQDGALSAGVQLGRVLLQGLEEAHLRRKVLPAVRHIYGCEGHAMDGRGHDPALVVEGRMVERRPLGRKALPDVEADAGVALRPMPVAPIPFHLAQGNRDLVGRRLDFLQADNVGLLPFHPFLHLGLPRTDPVYVPRRDFHQVFQLYVPPDRLPGI